SSGALGTGSTVSVNSTPAMVSVNPTVQLYGINEVKPGGCARQGTAVYCWGGNSAGRTGNGTADRMSPPYATLVSNVSSVAQLIVGSAACVLKSDATVWCWGENGVGQLGTGSITSPYYSATPVQVLASPGGPPFSGIVQIAGDAQHSCAIRSDS